MNIFNPFFIFWNTVNKYSYGIRASLVQMALCLVLMWGCWWLYIRFNTIPVFKNEIEIYEYKSKDISPELWFNANVNFGIYKYTTVPGQNGLMYKQDTINKIFLSPVFSDSLLEKAKRRAALRTPEKIGEGVMSEKYLALYDTLSNCVDTFDLNKAVYIIDFTYKQTFPDVFATKFAIPENDTIDNIEQYTRLFNTEIGQDYDTGQKTIEGRIIKVESDRTRRFSNMHMFFNGLTYGNTLSNSFFSIFNLYDISQAYIKFKYSGNANLHHVRFNFGSATMFTGVNPEHAEIGMDYLIFNDSTFINSSKMSQYDRRPINDFQLDFHVAPKDTQNLQTMRLFLLTTIFTLILTFFISALLKVLKIKVFPRLLILHRFVPRMKDNKDGKVWSVYDNLFKEYSQFTCHKNYDSEEVCEFYINECNNKYKKHFKASVLLKKRKENGKKQVLTKADNSD